MMTHKPPFGQVPIKKKGLPGNEDEELKVTDAMLAHAFFTTGRAQGSEFGYGAQSLAEFLHKWTALLAYFQYDRTNDQLCRSALALSLDPSEKSTLSYATGQAMTQIVAEKFLGVRRLIHLDRARMHNHIQVRGEERPDFLGWGPGGQLLVAEAKGRARRYDRKLLDKCASQLGAIESVGGQKPNLGLTSISWLDGNLVEQYAELHRLSAPTGCLSGVAGTQSSAQAAVIRAYYAPFLEAFRIGQAAPPIAGHEGASFDVAGVRIYLPTRLVEIVRGLEPSEDAIGNVDRAIMDTLELTEQGSFADGSIFRTTRLLGPEPT